MFVTAEEMFNRSHSSEIQTWRDQEAGGRGGARQQCYQGGDGRGQ